MESVRPLVITADPELLDALLRLAAAAQVDVDVAAEAALARRGWSQAPGVVVGDDVSRALIAAGLPRRPGVVLVTRDLDDAGVWVRGVGVGAERVACLPDGEAWLVGFLADAVEATGPRATTVGVMGGRGGAGASTLAVALAVAAERCGLSTCLIDHDRHGGGLDLALGGEDASGLRWPDLARAHGRLPGVRLAEALPRLHGVAVLSWDRGQHVDLPLEAVAAAIDAARRVCRLVVVDLSRAFDPAAHVVFERLDAVLLVVPAQVRATAAAQRVAATVAASVSDVRVVVRGPVPAGLTAADVAALLGLPLAGVVRTQARVAAATERGEPPGLHGRGALATLCRQLVNDLTAGPAAA